MKIKKFNNFNIITEKLDYSDVDEKLDDKYIDIKKELIEMIEKSLKGSTETVNLIDLENFIEDYLSTGKDASMIDGLIEDNDIFNFYLKYQTEIDELLNDTEYMDTPPKENNVYGLYDVIIDGTNQSILTLLEMVNSELFE